MFEIVDINIRIDHGQFSSIMDEVISDESSRTGISFDWAEKESHLSKSNLSMYKVTINNLDSSNNIDIVAEKCSNGDVFFKPISLRNYNETFYKFNYDEDDLKNVAIVAMKKLALKAKGSFGCIMDGNAMLVKDGRDISTHITGFAIIDDKGKVHHLKSTEKLDEEEDDAGLGYIPKYLINDMLEENPQFQMKLQTVPKEARFDFIAQFAVYQKRKGMMTADQFRDILLQVGNFADMAGGFKDESLRNIYQFFV